MHDAGLIGKHLDHGATLAPTMLRVAGRPPAMPTATLHRLRPRRRHAGSNCALSVEPAIAVVADVPPETAIATASK